MRLEEGHKVFFATGLAKHSRTASEVGLLCTVPGNAQFPFKVLGPLHRLNTRAVLSLHVAIELILLLLQSANGSLVVGLLRAQLPTQGFELSVSLGVRAEQMLLRVAHSRRCLETCRRCMQRRLLPRCITLSRQGAALAAGGAKLSLKRARSLVRGGKLSLHTLHASAQIVDSYP